MVGSIDSLFEWEEKKIRPISTVHVFLIPKPGWLSMKFSRD